MIIIIYISGYSAGSCVLGNKLEVFDKVDEPISFYQKDSIIYEGLGFIDYTFIPRYKSDYHKAYLIEELVNICIEKGIKNKTLKDGKVIIEYI